MTTPRLSAQKKRSKKKRQKTDRMKFAVLKRRLEKHGMYEMPPYSVIKFIVEHDGFPPDAVRIPETFDQVAFKRKINGLTLIVHTSFNPTLTRNTPKKKANGLYAQKGGAIWILIVDENGQRIFTRKRYRTPTLVERIPLEVELLINRMKNRPSFPGKRGKLHKATLKVIKFKTYWVSPVSDVFKQHFFSFGIPEHLRTFAKSLEYSRQYYRKYVRARNGTVRTENEIRKKWTVGNPSSVLRKVA